MIIKLTADNLMVHAFNDQKLLKKVNSTFPKELLPNREIETSRFEGLIIVPGGFINVDSDACYRYSDTQLRTRGNNIDIVEQIPVFFRVWKRTPTKDGHLKNVELRFSMVFDCKDLIEKYSLKKAQTLREFMGSRFNYNPRISKNIQELISDVQNIVEQSEKESEVSNA